MKIPLDIAEVLVNCNVDDVLDYWKLIHSEFSRETRWGVEKIYTVEKDGTFYQFLWETSSGDGDWTTADEGHDIELTEVKAVEKTVVEWVKV